MEYENLFKKNRIKEVLIGTLLLMLIGVRVSVATDSVQGQKLDMILGNPAAPVTIIDYSSLTCPHCASFHSEIFPRIKEDYIETGKAKLIFREVYFDGPGLWSSMLARCLEKKQFFSIIDLLFRKQDEWSRGESQIDIVKGLISIGRQAGISESKVLECLKDQEKAKELVSWYKNNAVMDSVQSTPTILINGVRINDNRNYDGIRETIDSYLTD